jgi:hypothetical protein
LPTAAWLAYDGCHAFAYPPRTRHDIADAVRGRGQRSPERRVVAPLLVFATGGLRRVVTHPLAAQVGGTGQVVNEQPHPHPHPGGSTHKELNMLNFDTLADVRSAIDQIDQMIAGLMAQRAQCERAADRFQPSAGHAAPQPVPAAQAQCAPCSGPR